MVFAGCATLSEKECRSDDWKGIGRDDGERGMPAAELERHQKACAEHGIEPDAERWRAGYAEGLRKYCTPAGGYVAGRRGDGYRDACPAGAAKFHEAHRRGLEVNRLVRDVAELRRRLDEIETAAVMGEYSPEERTHMRFRADDVGQQLRIREWDLERLDRRYAREFDAPLLTWQELRGPY